MNKRKKIVVGVVVFFLAFIIGLVGWIQVKPYYGEAMARVGGGLSAWTAGGALETVRQGKDVAEIRFKFVGMTAKGIGELQVDVSLSVSSYSFNVPLTIALVAGLFPFFRWRKRTIVEVCCLLPFIHLLYIYSYCILQLYQKISAAGFRTPSGAARLTMEFLWSFSDNMIIRFEPFLAAVYLWLRKTNLSRSAPG